MKKLIAVMAIALMLGQSPFCYAGISHDKAMHIGASTAAGIVLAQNKPFSKWKPWQRALFNVVVIGGAEKLI